MDTTMGPIAQEIAIAMSAKFHFASPGAFRPLEIERDDAPTGDPPSEPDDDPAGIPVALPLPGRRDAESGTPSRKTPTVRRQWDARQVGDLVEVLATDPSRPNPTTSRAGPPADCD